MSTVYVICPVHRDMLNRWSLVFGSRSVSNSFITLDFSGDLQLWVRTKTNESPYPLIGHEIPLVIKMHWMKKSFEGQNQKSYEDYKIGTRCSFILRYSHHNQYSGDLKSGLFWISNGRKEVGLQMVWLSIGI